MLLTPFSCLGAVSAQLARVFLFPPCRQLPTCGSRVLHHRFLATAPRFQQTMDRLTAVTLPAHIFNPSLISLVQEKWYGDLPPTATAPDDAALSRWYGLNRTAEQKKAFDEELKADFSPALEALGRERYPLPPQEEKERSVLGARELIRPLLQCQEIWGKEDETTVLSLVILLDQVSRNCFRDAAGQRLVYEHYDRIARALLRNTLELNPRDGLPDLYDVQNRGANYLNSARLTFFHMPFMHSEDLRDHELFVDRASAYKAQMEERGDEAAAEYTGRALHFEARHKNIIAQFGRYCHRNAVLGRQSRPEEQKFLDDGGDTFGTS